MYLGVHTYFDVGVSLILTFATALVLCKFFDFITSDKNVLAVSLILSVTAVLLAVYSFILSSVGYCDPAQIDGCFKTGGAGLGFALGYYIERRYIGFDPRYGSAAFQIIKFIIGVLGALFFKSVLKLILPGFMIFDFIRYFLTVFWVVALYPYLFTIYTKRSINGKSKA